MAQRHNYWSNSAFANIIRGEKKPGAATSSGWNDWEKATKEKHPIRYWIVEEGFDKVQNFLWWPFDQLSSFKYYLYNRFITRTHALTSLTLTKGSWHEFGTRVLNCNFDELVNFVEIETANSHIGWGEKEDRVKYNVPWHASSWLRLRRWRCPAAGLDHLYWAATLTYDSSMGCGPGSAYFGKLTPQAVTAKETLALYHWWKNVYPARPDVHDASGWTAICARRYDKNDDKFDFMGSNETPEEKAETRAALDISSEMEAAYEKEDEEMLVRFAKLAPKLWT